MGWGPKGRSKKYAKAEKYLKPAGKAAKPCYSAQGRAFGLKSFKRLLLYNPLGLRAAGRFIRLTLSVNISPAR